MDAIRRLSAFSRVMASCRYNLPLPIMDGPPLSVLPHASAYMWRCSKMSASVHFSEEVRSGNRKGIHSGIRKVKENFSHLPHLDYRSAFFNE